MILFTTSIPPGRKVAVWECDPDLLLSGEYIVPPAYDYTFRKYEIGELVGSICQGDCHATWAVLSDLIMQPHPIIFSLRSALIPCKDAVNIARIYANGSYSQGRFWDAQVYLLYAQKILQDGVFEIPQPDHQMDIPALKEQIDRLLYDINTSTLPDRQNATILRMILLNQRKGSFSKKGDQYASRYPDGTKPN